MKKYILGAIMLVMGLAVPAMANGPDPVPTGPPSGRGCGGKACGGGGGGGFIFVVPTGLGVVTVTVPAGH
jgi:hypothetical protein